METLSARSGSSRSAIGTCALSSALLNRTSGVSGAAWDESVPSAASITSVASCKRRVSNWYDANWPRTWNAPAHAHLGEAKVEVIGAEHPTPRRAPLRSPNLEAQRCARVAIQERDRRFGRDVVETVHGCWPCRRAPRRRGGGHRGAARDRARASRPWQSRWVVWRTGRIGPSAFDRRNSFDLRHVRAKGELVALVARNGRDVGQERKVATHAMLARGHDHVARRRHQVAVPLQYPGGQVHDGTAHLDRPVDGQVRGQRERHRATSGTVTCASHASDRPRRMSAPPVVCGLNRERVTSMDAPVQRIGDLPSIRGHVATGNRDVRRPDLYGAERLQVEAAATRALPWKRALIDHTSRTSCATTSSRSMVHRRSSGGGFFGGRTDQGGKPSIGARWATSSGELGATARRCRNRNERPLARTCDASKRFSRSAEQADMELDVVEDESPLDVRVTAADGELLGVDAPGNDGPCAARSGCRSLSGCASTIRREERGGEEDVDRDDVERGERYEHHDCDADEPREPRSSPSLSVRRHVDCGCA